MTEIITNTIAFVVLISILVAVHEYGHFIVGRWTGMKVLRFSIGFGKPIWTHVGQKDRTEFCVSAIPLGGYVRFLDSREEGFDRRPTMRAVPSISVRSLPVLRCCWRVRLFNFVFAIAAYWVLLAGGVTGAVNPAVGTVVEPDSYAAAGWPGVRRQNYCSVGDVVCHGWLGSRRWSRYWVKWSTTARFRCR